MSTLLQSIDFRQFQLAQNEHGTGEGAGDHRGSISSTRRKASSAHQKRIRQQNLLFSFICLLACVFLCIIFFGESWREGAFCTLDLIHLPSGFYMDIHPLIDTVATTLGYQNKQYAVVIDAGSTGSRVLAYEFHKAVSSEFLWTAASRSGLIRVWTLYTTGVIVTQNDNLFSFIDNIDKWCVGWLPARIHPNSIRFWRGHSRAIFFRTRLDVLSIA